MNLDEYATGRKLDLTCSIDIGVPLIIQKKIPAHVQTRPNGKFPKPAEWSVVIPLFIRELNPHRRWLAGCGVVDANVDGVKGLRHVHILSLVIQRFANY